MMLRRYLTESKKLLSVGIILTDGEVFLAVHPTNKSFWDIPKGLQDSLETIEATLFREVWEETNIKLAKYKNKLRPLGKFSFSKEKDIFAYLLKMDDLPPINKMKCKSLTRMGFPEVDKWKYISFDKLGIFKPKMVTILRYARNEI